MNKKETNIKQLCLIGFESALICVISPFALPTGLGVPFTLQTFIISLVAIIFDAKHATISTLIYVLLGAFGLPVFSNFTGGWQSIVGMSGGFILSFPIMACVIGLGSKLHKKTKWALPLSIIIGNLINLICGTIYFYIITNSSLHVTLITCVWPFIPATLIKAVASYIVGVKLKQRLSLI